LDIFNGKAFFEWGTGRSQSQIQKKGRMFSSDDAAELLMKMGKKVISVLKERIREWCPQGNGLLNARVEKFHFETVQ